MRSWPRKWFLLSGALSLVGWSLEQITEPFYWLPWITLSLGVSGLAIFGILWLIDFARLKTRSALPGYGAHMAIQLHEGIRGRRRYIFELGEAGRRGAALYISASDRLVFEVRDLNGEPYALELPLGRRGVPIGEPIYLGVEAGRYGNTSVMRFILDGKVVAERRIPFAVDFGEVDPRALTLGANISGRNHAAFELNNIQHVACTLSDKDARGMSQFQAARLHGA